MRSWDGFCCARWMRSSPEESCSARPIDDTWRRSRALRLRPPPEESTDYNYAYFPVEIDESEFGCSRDVLYTRLKEWNVFARRYFYPLVTDFACYRGMVPEHALPVSRRVAERIITLPIFHDLSTEDVARIAGMIRQIQRESAVGTIPGVGRRDTGSTSVRRSTTTR